jgi:CRISPR-associated protein Csb2
MFGQPPYRPVISGSHGYGPPDKREAGAPGSVFDPKIEIFRLAPKESTFHCLELATTLQLTQRLHEAMLKNVSAPDQTPEIISGHKPDHSPTDKPHIAYIPIPFVGGQHGDGHLLGFGIVVPRSLDADPKAVKALMAGLGGLVQNGLKLGRLGAWSVEEDWESRRPGQMLCAETWTAFEKGATRWASVTPVVFDQHPKARSKAQYLVESAQLVTQMCERIGLPRPSVRVTPVSRFAGAPTAYDFPRLRRKDGSERRQIHVVIEFGQKVVGPILIGAGRYRGYGLLKPDFTGGAL